MAQLLLMKLGMRIYRLFLLGSIVMSMNGWAMPSRGVVHERELDSESLHYTRQANGILLAPSAERLILRVTHAKRITYVSKLIFRQFWDRHYLGLNISVIPANDRGNGPGPAWEGVWQLELVLQKHYQTSTWQHAVVYAPKKYLQELFASPWKEFVTALGKPVQGK